MASLPCVPADECGLDVLFLPEFRTGQVHALRHGFEAATGAFVAICDADTWYPPHYLEHAERMCAERGDRCVAVCAANPSTASGLRAPYDLA